MRVEHERGIRVFGIALLLLSVAACGSSDSSGGEASGVEERTETEGDGATGEADVPGGEVESQSDAEDQGCAYGCNDGLACTEDACVNGKCVNELLTGACLYEGVCFGEFELHPTDSCLVADALRCDPTNAINRSQGDFDMFMSR